MASLLLDLALGQCLKSSMIHSNKKLSPMHPFTKYTGVRCGCGYLRVDSLGSEGGTQAPLIGYKLKSNHL